jgi:nucleoside-diphosphate-sugar epimerase
VDINVSGTLNLIQLCREYGARLYFASSSEVYGERGSDAPLTEELVDEAPVLPHNCHGISKLQAEQYLRHFVDCYALQALSFRFFMCYSLSGGVGLSTGTEGTSSSKARSWRARILPVLHSAA